MWINRHGNSITHNTSRRTGKIKYICIHYVGAAGDAADNIEYYSRSTTTEASADFYVGHTGDVWQYNTDPLNRYCWAVGGGRQSQYGGRLHGVVKNHNSISVEMCVKTRGNKTQANHPDWYFTRETIDSAVELTRHLMEEYDVSVENVIRHFDVTGKLCPGVVGWNYPSGDESAWLDFRKRIAQAVQPFDEGPADDCGQEDDDMLTQEQFNRMMDNYLAALAKREPSEWSEDAREWAESNGVINGDGSGNMQYKKFCTREELIQILFNMGGG